MRLSRLQLLVGLAVVVLVVATVALVAPSSGDVPELSIHSVAPGGGRALWLWLEDLGYAVEAIDEEPYAVAPGTSMVLVLEPTVRFDNAALDRLEQWVEDGGQLVLVATGRGARRLLDRFGLQLEFSGTREGEAAVVQPVLLQPPVERASVRAWETLLASDGLVPWLAVGDGVYAGSRPFGQGRVIALSASYPLSNAGLATPDNVALALNLVGGLPPGARVAFDEYHHGFVRRGARGLGSLLGEHYWGWAALYVVALGYLYLALSGRRFGHALANSGPARRTVGEYVASLATLYRRAGLRGYAGDRLADALKLQLGSALGLSARLPDAAFAEAVAARRQVEPAPLARLLARLRDGSRLSEGALLSLAREADELARRLVRRTP